MGWFKRKKPELGQVRKRGIRYFVWDGEVWVDTVHYWDARTLADLVKRDASHSSKP